MAKTRSPQYPAIGLKEAIDKVRAVWNQDRQTPTQRDVIASHMGYNSLNGKSLGVLSAIGKYGLLEGRGAEYRVSDLALRIIAHQSGDPERTAAIQEAAAKPDLFNELDKRFSGGKVSDQAIRSHLLMQKFIPSAADAAIRAYRETKLLVEQETDDHNAGGQTEMEPLAMATKTEPSVATRQHSSAPPAPMALHMGDVGLPFTVSLTGSGLEIGARIKNEGDVESLIQILQTMKPLLPTIYGQPKATVVPPDASDPAQRVFEASMEGREREEGVSFFITQTQKNQLRERGYTDDQIHDMKPEEAHRVLGLIN